MSRIANIAAIQTPVDEPLFLTFVHLIRLSAATTAHGRAKDLSNSSFVRCQIAWLAAASATIVSLPDSSSVPTLSLLIHVRPRDRPVRSFPCQQRRVARQLPAPSLPTTRCDRARRLQPTSRLQSVPPQCARRLPDRGHCGDPVHARMQGLPALLAQALLWLGQCRNKA